MSRVGLYIHIPFCVRKCPYCDFYSVAFDDNTADKYTDALLRSFTMEKYRGVTADTVYLGGGTPSVLGIGQLERLIKGIRDIFTVTEDAEITIEANPGTVDYNKLSAYRKMDINRISFGVQSADDRELAFLGRLHDINTAEQAVNDAYKAGFENISVDIMLGLAGQSTDGLLASARRLAKLPISHISAYMLKIEPGTPFDNDAVRGQIAGDELMSDIYLSLSELLPSLGFEQYEISNFALKGFESRHNLKYWTGGEYIGFGPSAHSLFKGQRYYVDRNIARYIASPVQSESAEEQPYSERDEYIMLSLRLSSGLSVKRLCALYGDSRAGEIVKYCKLLEKNGLCETSPDRVRLTPRGFLVSNSIILRLSELAGIA